MSQDYYIVDYGKDMVDLAQTMVNELREANHHVVVYLTDLDFYVSAIKVTEDEFLTHFNITTGN